VCKRVCIFYCVVIILVSFMFPSVYALRKLLCFHCVPLSRCLCQHQHLFASHEYWTDFDEIWGGNLYRQQSNRLHFGRNCNGWRSWVRQNIQIDVKAMLPRNEWLHKFHSTYGMLCLQGWRVHCTHVVAEALYDRTQCLAL